MSHKLTGPSKLLFGFFFGLILCGGVLVYADAFDVSTATIPYTGWVDNNGVPVNNTKTTMNFAFYLKPDCSDDSPTWQATNDWPQGGVDVTPYHGRFSVELGDTGQNPLKEDLFNNALIYLKIAIAGMELTGCQKIVPSRMASSSQRSHNFTVTTLNVTGNTTLKATTVGGNLDVTGNTTLKATTVDGTLKTINGNILTRNIDIRSSDNDPDNGVGILSMNQAQALWAHNDKYTQDGGNPIERKLLVINRNYTSTTAGRHSFRDVTIRGKTVSFPDGNVEIGEQSLSEYIKQEANTNGYLAGNKPGIIIRQIVKNADELTITNDDNSDLGSSWLTLVEYQHTSVTKQDHHLLVEFFSGYTVDGHGEDHYESQLLINEVVRVTQRQEFSGHGGGGTRGNTLFPIQYRADNLGTDRSTQWIPIKIQIRRTQGGDDVTFDKHNMMLKITEISK